MSDPLSTLTLYPSPIPDGDYLAVLDYCGIDGSTTTLPKPTTESNIQHKTIIILDVSGSMFDYVSICCDHVFPVMFQNAGYSPDDEIDFIRFESSIHYNKHKVSEFGSLGYICLGGTTMAPVFEALDKVLSGYPEGSHVKIVCISDGDVWDQQESLEASSKLAARIESNALNLQIDSLAIRLFTSDDANPDTRALSSVLQFGNTINTPELIDIMPDNSLDPYVRAALLKPLFSTAFKLLTTPTSYLSTHGTVGPTIVKGSSADIQHDKSFFKQNPWSPTSTLLSLSTAQTLFWVSKAQWDRAKPQTLTISDVCDVKVIEVEELSGAKYEEIVSSRVNHYMMLIKLLRLVNTPHSIKQIEQMSSYFIKLEELILKDYQQIDEVRHDDEVLYALSDRIAQLKRNAGKKQKFLAFEMAKIANMDATVEFNSAQAATFLRSTNGSTAASKGLIRRAGTGADLDFDKIVRREMLAIAQSLHELEAKISPEMESEMNKSFVSLGSTMDGLRAIRELSRTGLTGEEIAPNEVGMRQSILTTMSAFEMLSYFNIVGVPIQGTIGDYPDPYRYNINQIFTGHHCSLSDLMNIHTESEPEQAPDDTQGAADAIQPYAPLPTEAKPNATLNVPGYKGDLGRIDNVVPFFEYSSIGGFLHKYAPKSISFLASIGMRRVMVNISETHYALLSAALVKLMRVVSVEPSAVNLGCFSKLIDELTFNQTMCNSAKAEIGNAAHFVDYYVDVFAQTFKPKDEETNDNTEAQINEETGQSQEEKQNVVACQNYHAGTLPSHIPTQYKSFFHKLDLWKPRLPQVHSSLTVLIFPLLLATKSMGLHLTKPGNEQTTITVTESSLSAIFRSLYVNEAWIGLRNIYRNKPDSTKILETHFNSLLGLDTDWEPALTPLDEVDSEFHPDMVPRWEELAFFKSKSWKELSPRLNRLNVILTIPFFARLLKAWGHPNGTNSVDELVQDVPRVIVTPETPELLKKQRILAFLQQELAVRDPSYTPTHTVSQQIKPEDILVDGRADGVDLHDIDAIKVKIAEMEENFNGKRDQTFNNVEMAWPQVLFNSPSIFYGLPDPQPVESKKDCAITNAEEGITASSKDHQTDPELDFPPNSVKHLNTLKLMAILYAFIYPEGSSRFSNTVTPGGDCLNLTRSFGTNFEDIPYTDDIMEISFIPNLLEFRTQWYADQYQKHLQIKAKKELEALIESYREQLLQTDDRKEFISLLKNGLTRGSTTASFAYGHRDWHLVPLWDALINPDIQIPLRLDKLEIIILGVDSASNDEPVWNNGNILFDHELHKASKVFYTDEPEDRTKWIEISEKYKTRRQSFKYRDGDLANRHSHKTSHPSYYSFGYDTLVQYKAAVSEEEYIQYCSKHTDCCGLTPVGQKRQSLGGFRHYQEEDDSSEPVVPSNMITSDGEEDEDFDIDLFGLF